MLYLINSFFFFVMNYFFFPNFIGMYSHIKALTRMNAADVPVGTSIEKEGSGSSSSSGNGKIDAKNFGAVASAMAKDVATTQKGNARVSGFNNGGSVTNTQGAMSTASKGVGAAKVHGFGNGSGNSGGTTAGAMSSNSKGVANVHGFGGGSKPTLSSTFHNHEDAFQRRKGVVNTIGGAKDVNRINKEPPPSLPGKGEKKGAHIMGLDMLDQHTVEGKARREAAEKRMKSNNPIKTTAVHVSGGGGRPKPADIFKEKMAKMETASTRTHRIAPTVNVLDENSSLTHVPSTTNTTASSNNGGGNDMRAARAAHFEKMFADQQAKKKAAAEAAGLA